jgi:carbon storage regulator
MLVLRRTTGQQIVIAGTIRITILKVQGDHVKVGIESPAEISVLRGELVPGEQPVGHSATEQNAERTHSCSTPPLR